MGLKDIARSIKAQERLEGTTSHYLKQSITNHKHFYSPKVLRKLAERVQSSTMSDDKTELLTSLFGLFSAFFANNTREVGFHPSSFMQECPRKIYYDLTGAPSKPTPPITPELQSLFDLGTLIHLYIQFHLWNAKVLVVAEGDIHYKIGTFDIVGHTDGKIHLPEWPKGEMDILEIKSINSFGFSRLVEPLDHHVEQASIYAGAEGIEHITFIYYNKDTSQTKEFRVPANKKYFERAVKTAKLIDKAASTKSPPERVCMTTVSPQALKCSFCSHCFSE